MVLMNPFSSSIDDESRVMLRAVNDLYNDHGMNFALAYLTKMMTTNAK